MRILLFLLLGLLFGSTAALAQERVAMPFSEAEDYALSAEYLDGEYRDAAHVDTSKAVFPENQSEVHAAWIAMAQELSAFLTDQDFRWGEPTQVYYRVYFSPDGSVDHFLYNPDNVPADQRGEFDLLLNEFVEDYRFELSAEEHFAQCSPVRFQDATEQE